jgi:mannose-6-phosphate isomerase
MDAKYRRADGLYRKLVNDDGTVADDGVTLYDQAFALLAWSAVARTSAGLDTAQARGREILAVLKRNHAHPVGGFREDEKNGATLQSNPHMHLLEAALSWMTSGGGSEWSELGATSVQLARDYFMDVKTGAVREYFEDSGAPVAGPAGRMVEPGHQFEWSHLLAKWAELTGDNTTLSAARRLYDIGARHGIDPARRVAIDVLWDDMTTMSAEARLWPQTEWLKSALAMARLTPDAADRAAIERDGLMAAHALVQYLDSTVPGLWRDKLRADGTFVEEPSPASSLYHIAGAILALRRYVA